MEKQAMEYRRLGNSDLEISVITLGAWQFGCERYWGKVPKTDIRRVIEKALDSGINTIDTAIGYDDSELIVGDAVKDIRDRVLIISKGGADPRKIPRRVELSLERLGLEYLDLYLVHYPDTDIPIEDTMEAMVRIKEQGKTRHIGVSNFSADQLSRAAAAAETACCQQAFNLMWREIEDTGTLEICEKYNIGVLAYSPLGQGLFTGKIRSADDLPKRENDIRHITSLFKGDAFERGLEIVEVLDGLAKKYGRTPAQIAINWVVNRRGITSAIVGSKNLKQLDDNLGGVGWEMEEGDYELLSSEGGRHSKIFDYSYSIFGFKYDEVKIDQMIDDSM
jgi:aryl-alcohol dehydrogenase-like predicted oxidoreductase